MRLNLTLHPPRMHTKTQINDREAGEVGKHQQTQRKQELKQSQFSTSRMQSEQFARLD